MSFCILHNVCQQQNDTLDIELDNEQIKKSILNPNPNDVILGEDMNFARKRNEIANLLFYNNINSFNS